MKPKIIQLTRKRGDDYSAIYINADHIIYYSPILEISDPKGPARLFLTVAAFVVDVEENCKTITKLIEG